MNTYCSVQVYANKKLAKESLKKVFSRLEEIDRKFNVYRPGNELYKFNQDGTPIEDREIINLVRIALKVSEESNGAFDITVYPLMNLWGFPTKSEVTPHVPSKEDILKVLKKVNYRNLVIKSNMLYTLKKGVGIDLGGIAKGYAADEVVKILKSMGINSALIDLGGNIYAFGKYRGRLWKVGIKNPFGEGIMGVFEASDLSLVTSGVYERFFVENGVKYHHIMDPETGYPTRNFESVTVICPSSTLADAWSTALFVIGPEKGLKLVETKKDMECIMVTPKGEILCSKGLKEKLEIIKKQKK